MTNDKNAGFDMNTEQNTDLDMNIEQHSINLKKKIKR